MLKVSYCCAVLLWFLWEARAFLSEVFYLGTMVEFWNLRRPKNQKKNVFNEQHGIECSSYSFIRFRHFDSIWKWERYLKKKIVCNDQLSIKRVFRLNVSWRAERKRRSRIFSLKTIRSSWIPYLNEFVQRCVFSSLNRRFFQQLTERILIVKFPWKETETFFAARKKNSNRSTNQGSIFLFHRNLCRKRLKHDLFSIEMKCFSRRKKAPFFHTGKIDFRIRRKRHDHSRLVNRSHFSLLVFCSIRFENRLCSPENKRKRHRSEEIRVQKRKFTDLKQSDKLRNWCVSNFSETIGNTVNVKTWYQARSLWTCLQTKCFALKLERFSDFVHRYISFRRIYIDCWTRWTKMSITNRTSIMFTTASDAKNNKFCFHDDFLSANELLKNLATFRIRTRKASFS